MDLSIRGICKNYNSLRAASNVSFTLKSGTITGFLGSNGAGKTTVLKILLGLLQPDHGFVVSVQSEDEVSPASTGTVLDKPSFFSHLTGRENLYHLGKIGESLKVDGRSIEEHVNTALKRTNLLDVADRKVSSYSTGMNKRLAIAWAILFQRDFLILDEPFEGLDPESRVLLRTIVKEAAADGAAVVISSHQLSEIEELCSHIVFLRKGQVVFSGSPESFCQPESSVIRFTSTVTKLSNENEKEQVQNCIHTTRPEFTTKGFELPSPWEEIPKIISALSTAGIQIYEVKVVNQSLEEIFLRLKNDDGTTTPPDKALEKRVSGTSTPPEEPRRITHYPPHPGKFLTLMKRELKILTQSWSMKGLLLLPSILQLLAIPLLLLSPWVFSGFRAKYIIPAVNGCITLSLSFGRYLFPVICAVILSELFAGRTKSGTIDTVLTSGVSRGTLYLSSICAASLWIGLSVILLQVFYGVNLTLGWLFLDATWWAAYNLPLTSITASATLLTVFYLVAQISMIGYWTFFSVISSSFGKSVTKGLFPLFLMAVTGSLSQEICALLGMKVNPALIFLTTQYSKIGDFDLLDGVYNHGVAPWPPFFLRDVTLLVIQGIFLIAVGAIIFKRKDFHSGKN